MPITDIIIKMNGQDDCTVTRVAELVKDEVGFDVIRSATRLWIQMLLEALTFGSRPEKF